MTTLLGDGRLGPGQRTEALRQMERERFEAPHERHLMLERPCPQLARPVPFLIPLERPGTNRAYLGASVAPSDLLTPSRAVRRHRHLPRRGALRLAPALRGRIVLNAAGVRTDELQALFDGWDRAVDRSGSE